MSCGGLTRRHTGFAMAALASLAVVGCEIRKYAVVTRIEPDGRFYRAIEQPRDDTLPPEALVAPKQYPPSTQPADYVLKPEWVARWNIQQPMAAAPATAPATAAATDAQAASAPASAPADDEGKIFITVRAAGIFPAADAIPRNYHLIAYPLDDHVSTNRIEHTCEDLLLFAIDDWSETITETVVLHEYADTVGEMIGMILPAYAAAVDEVFGSRYDFSRLYTFVSEEGPTAAFRLAFHAYQTRPEKTCLWTPQVRTAHLRDILAAWAFRLPLNENGDGIDGPKLDDALRQFCTSLLTGHVLDRASGQLLTPAQADEMLGHFGLGPEPPASSQPATGAADASRPAAGSQPASPPATQPASPWDNSAALFRRHFLRLHGREFDAMALLWGARTGGAHRRGPLSFFDPDEAQYVDGREYTYRLETAGPVLETNGKRTGDCSIVWQFEDSDLWPEGTRMHARAVRWNRPGEQKLFGRTVLTNLDTLLAVRDAVAGHESVRSALKQALEQASLEPLRKLAEAADQEENKAARTIVALGDGD